MAAHVSKNRCRLNRGRAILYGLRRLFEDFSTGNFNCQIVRNQLAPKLTDKVMHSFDKGEQIASRPTRFVKVFLLPYFEDFFLLFIGTPPAAATV
jgi:hypothetical protein